MLNRIKELRNKNNLTLRALGQKVNMSSSRLSQYETGKREPKLETWQKLADFFDVPTSYLQGFGISKKDHKCILYADEIENFSQKDLKIIFKDKQAFTNFMSDRFRSVFNYNSLANIRDDEELEKKMTIALSGWSRKNVYDGVLAELQDIDFKKDSNDEIIEKLSSIFTDIFMYIDSDDNNKN